MRRQPHLRLSRALSLALLAASCHSLPPLLPDDGGEPAAPQELAPAAHHVPLDGHAIVACGERFFVDAPVVLWNEPPFYDAYSLEPRLGPSASGQLRYRPARSVHDPALAASVASQGWTLDTLRQAVDLFVVHYDACGTSQECFRVLHGERGLSVHFLLDVDGTIYQTLDLVHEAWHAGGEANPRSIGIEIAHAGAFAPGAAGRAYAPYYERDEQGVRLVLDQDSGVRTPDFAGRPARADLVHGDVHGEELVQYDFTPEQYASLEALTAALVQLFPRITLAAPREPGGAVRSTTLTSEELARFHGILGHLHVGSHKVDPGPAFDWEGFLAGVRERLAAP